MGAVTCVGFSPVSNLLVTGAEGRSHQVQLWDCVTWKHLWDMQGHTQGVLCMAFRADGLLVTGSR